MALVEIMQNWTHPGFSVFQREPIDPDDHEARRRLAGYMVHPPIALEPLRYGPETSQVIYYGRQHGRCGDADSSPARIFPALDFLAALCTHIPDSGQLLVRYYGAFSNVPRVAAEARPSAPAADPPDSTRAASGRVRRPPPPLRLNPAAVTAGSSVPESGAGTGRGSESRRRASLPLPL
jgi:hypothetical protein